MVETKKARNVQQATPECCTELCLENIKRLSASNILSHIALLWSFRALLSLALLRLVVSHEVSAQVLSKWLIVQDHAVCGSVQIHCLAKRSLHECSASG